MAGIISKIKGPALAAGLFICPLVAVDKKYFYALINWILKQNQNLEITWG